MTLIHSFIIASGLTLGLASSAAHAETFEAKAASAERVQHLDDTIWALTTSCEQGDDVAQRQCRHVRDGRVAALAGATLLIDGEPDAFEVGKWSGPKKSVPVTLSACIRCDGIEIEGKTIYVVGTTAQPRFEAGKLRTSSIYDTAHGFGGAGASISWTSAVRGAHVQLLVKVPSKPHWQLAGKLGIALEIVGYRVYTPCTGAIIVASDPSGPLEPDRKQCTRPGEGTIEPTSPGEEPEVLTPEVVREAFVPVIKAAHVCFEQLGVTGTARLEVTIAADGSVARYDQTGDFKLTPTGDCIDRAVMKAQFPRSKKALTKIVYPIELADGR